MKIGRVEEALVAGKMLRRNSWPKEHFIFRQVPSVIGSEIIPRMQSLPLDVKETFIKRFNDEPGHSISYTDQVCYVGDGNVLINFAFQAADVFAQDWEEFKG